jgi:DNA-binding NarL/FixJ family response regulator
MIHKPRIIVIEDEPLIAEDIADICTNAGYTVHGTAYNVGQGMNLIDEHQPDLIMLDINLNDEINGLELGTHIYQHNSAHIIYITSYADVKTIEAAKMTHPLGYIVKPFHPQQVITTIEIAWGQLNRSFINEFNLEAVNERLFKPLTEREAEIINCIFKGKDTKSISNQLFISTNTVKFHLKNINEKLGTHSRIDLLSKIRELTET